MGYDWGMWGFGWLFMALFWIFVIVGVVWLVLSVSAQRDRATRGADRTAVRIWVEELGTTNRVSQDTIFNGKEN